MGRTKIEWATDVWNPLTGCTKVSEGCRNCYAIRQARRMDGQGVGYDGTTTKGLNWSGQVNLLHERLTQPLSWRKPRRVFVNSMSDLFHPSVPDEFIDAVFTVMAACPQHTFQVLTKRPGRMREYTQALYAETGRLNKWLYDGTCFHPPDNLPDDAIEAASKVFAEKCLPDNVWLGTSVENQWTAHERIPHLLQSWGVIRFLSCEPLLGPVDLEPFLHHETLPRPDWVIAGGESGPGARPMHPHWPRLLRDQCLGHDIPFCFKQWGAHRPCQGYQERERSFWVDGRCEKVSKVRMVRVGKGEAGRVLHGEVHDGHPILAHELLEGEGDDIGVVD